MEKFEVGKEYKNYFGEIRTCTKRTNEKVWFDGYYQKRIIRDIEGNEYVPTIIRIEEIKAEDVQNPEFLFAESREKNIKGDNRMDNKQAIEMLRDWNKGLSLMEDEEDGIKCHEMAISALEKQIPKKPIMHKGTKRADCPVCGATVRGIKDSFGNWCSKCGQAIDWSK